MTKELGESFSKYMENAGFTSQRELARRTGVSKTTIQRVVKGERGLSPELSIRFADILSIFNRDERIGFHLLSDGYSKEYIDAVFGRSSPFSLEMKTPSVREIRRNATVIRIIRY